MNLTGYNALREATAWGDFSGRGKIRLTGNDRARLLHAMSTNHIQQLQPGSGVYAFFLSAQGRIQADANIFCLPDAFLLDTEPEIAEKLYQHLDKYIIADDVTLEDLTSVMATMAVEGRGSREVLRSLGAPAPETDESIEAWGTALVARVSQTGGPGYFIFIPVTEKADLIARLETAGAVAADAEAFRAVRLERGQPRYGDDISDRYLVQETQQLRAVHFQKGCYLGQEIVERVRARGQVHRHLMPLRIETTEPPAPGEKLTGENGQPAGELTSAAYSPAFGKVVALAYVRTDAAKPGTRLLWNGVAAEVESPVQS